MERENTHKAHGKESELGFKSNGVKSLKRERKVMERQRARVRNKRAQR